MPRATTRKRSERRRRIPGGFWTKFNRERAFIEEFLIEQQSSLPRNNYSSAQHDTEALTQISSIKCDLINEVRKKGLVDDDEDASAVIETDESIGGVKRRLKSKSRGRQRIKAAELDQPKPSLAIYYDEFDEQTIVHSGVNNNNNNVMTKQDCDSRGISLKKTIAFTEKILNQMKMCASRIVLTRNSVIEEKSRSMNCDGWNKENALLVGSSLVNGMDGFKILVKRCPATNEYKIVSPQ